jgi:predicted ATPase
MTERTTLHLKHVGPIREASVQFGDLTVLVGPQASGKSIFLQLFKLLMDAPCIRAELRRFNIDWQGDAGVFSNIYFGDGMSGLWSDESRVALNSKPIDVAALAREPKGRKSSQRERLFFIPAQRVMTLRDGLTRPFTDYRSGDPFTVREFSEKLHQLVQNEFTQGAALFPQPRRLKSTFRDRIDQHIFGGFGLKSDTEKYQRRIVLSPPGGGEGLPYLVWSAGQREFVPLLLGLYWLMPPAAVSTRDDLKWVVIEEPEMGLHPNAISVTLTLVMELLHRGYRVCLSTHSPHVLDVMWALQVIKKHGGTAKDVLDLLDLPSDPTTRPIASHALEKDYRAYFFSRSGAARDISDLRPDADDQAEAGWGGLTDFSGHVGDVVSKVIARQEREHKNSPQARKLHLAGLPMPRRYLDLP